MMVCVEVLLLLYVYLKHIQWLKLLNLMFLNFSLSFSFFFQKNLFTLQDRNLNEGIYK